MESASSYPPAAEVTIGLILGRPRQIHISPDASAQTPLASMLLFELFRRLRGRSAAPPLAPAALPTQIVVFGIEIGFLVIFCCISSSDADCRGQGGGSSILRSFAGFVLVSSVHVLARAVASTSTFSCLIASSLSSPAETLPPSMLPSFPPRSRELF